MTHLGDRLSAWLDGELGAADRAAAADHLSACAGCREELDTVAAGRRAVRGLPLLQPSGDAIPPAARRPVRRMGWAAAATAATVLAAGLWIGPGEPGAAFEMDVLDRQHTARVVGDPGISTFRGEQP